MTFADIDFGILDILWFGIGVIIIATVMACVKTKPFSPSRLETLQDAEIPEYFSEVLEKWEPQLQDIGFSPTVTLRFDVHNSATLVLRIYESPDCVEEATLVDIRARLSAVNTAGLSFRTHLSPHGRLITSNYVCRGRSTDAPYDLVSISMPWMQGDALELLRIHREFSEQAKAVGFHPQKVRDHDWEEFLLRGPYEIEVKRGRMKRLPNDAYRVTFLGVILSVPKAIRMMCPSIKKTRQPSMNELRRRVHDRFVKALTMPEELKTYHHSKDS